MLNGFANVDARARLSKDLSDKQLAKEMVVVTTTNEKRIILSYKKIQ